MDKTKRPMPDWMMRYVSNIGTEECYRKFRELSKEYYEEAGDPSGGGGGAKAVTRLHMDKYSSFTKHSAQPNHNTDRGDFDITEKYKRLSRELSHEFDYVEKKLIEEMRENDPTLDNGRQLLSREDQIANTLHKLFAEKYPEKAARSNDVERSYRNIETQEYNEKFHQAKNSKKFEKAQDKFQEDIFNARSKSDQQDDKDPDPNGTGGRSKSSEFENNSTNKRCEKFLENSFDISSNKMLKTYFESRGMTQKMLDDLTSRDSSFVDKNESRDKDNTKDRTKTETDRSRMVDAYFKKHGIVINKSEQGTSSIGRTISNDNFSITYTKQVSDGEPKKSRNLDKDKD